MTNQPNKGTVNDVNKVAKVAIVMSGSVAGNAAMVDYLKNKIAHLEAEIEVIQADQLPESGSKPEAFIIDRFHIDEIEEIKLMDEFRSLKEHRGKHRTHRHKYGR